VTHVTVDGATIAVGSVVRYAPVVRGMY